MPPTAQQFAEALAEIEEDTAMPPGMTQQQYAEAREMMERVEDVEFYEAMTEDECASLKDRFLVENDWEIEDAFGETPVDQWDGIGAKFRERFLAYAVAQLREKYRTSGELLECVREAVMCEEAEV